MARLTKMANLATVCHGFAKCSNWMAKGDFDENRKYLPAMAKMANLAKNCQRVDPNLSDITRSPPRVKWKLLTIHFIQYIWP